MRLDIALVEKKLCETRNKAQQIIRNGIVSVNNKIIKKASFKIKEDDSILVLEHKSYVSRAAFKLLYFLEELNFNVSEKTALDIGSSTGGFTQVLLEKGAKKVTCVDVGHDQLHYSLVNDKRVEVYEGCDIRSFMPDTAFELIVSDVAFISLLYILDDIDRVSTKDIILLFKPQFEVGREVKRDKNGVVLDLKAIDKAMQKFEDKTALKGWKLIKKSPSKLAGKEGNVEWCYFFKK